MGINHNTLAIKACAARFRRKWCIAYTVINQKAH